jgi:hypothetical protein
MDMRLTYRAMRVESNYIDEPDEIVEVEFKVNDNPGVKVHLRHLAEAAMLKATGNPRVHGWGLVS